MGDKSLQCFRNRERGLYALEFALLLPPVFLLFVFCHQFWYHALIEIHLMAKEKEILEMYPLTQSNVSELREKYKQYFLMQNQTKIALVQSNARMFRTKLTSYSVCEMQIDWIFSTESLFFNVRKRWIVPVVCAE